MKKLKIISFSLGALAVIGAPIGIIVASKISTNSSGISIVGQGSSSVKPIIDSVMQDTYYDVEYQATGSGDGFKSQTGVKATSAFGMTSSLKHPEDKEVADQWGENNNRTLTFAVDAIGIVLNLPDGIIFPKGTRPEISIEEISKIYDLDTNTNTTWGSLLTNESLATTDNNSLSLIVNGLGRTGGKEASGTSDGFWHTLKKHMHSGNSSDADLNHENLPPENLTPEANSQSLNILKEKESSLTYISLGYALNNETSNAVIASIKSGTDIWEPSIESVSDGTYKWTRPFNIIFSTDNKEAMTFVNFLLSPEVQDLIKAKNFVPLTKQQHSDQLPINETDLDRGADLLMGTNMGLKV